MGAAGTERPTERRLITCVFIDVVGSTDLTTRLGPERMRRLLDDAFAQISAHAAAEGGTVEKYIGDEVFVLFGAPAAHSDDPARALRVADACVRWARTSDTPLSVRVGVETGEALVDLAGVENRQRMAVGTCVNVAARLQQHASPGEVLVGPVCRVAADRVAEFEGMGTLELKGLGRVAAARLLKLADRPIPATSFVGRTDDQAKLRAAFERTTTGHATLVLVTGEPGIGKTRLAEEFIRGLAGAATVLRARCRPGTEVGASPLLQLVADREPSSLPSTLAHAVGLTRDERLLTLSMFDRRNEIAAGWRSYLADLARDHPVVVWIDDVHWAEPETIHILDRATFQSDAPIMVLATARADFPGITAIHPGEDRTFLELAPLGLEDAATLAATVGARQLERTLRAAGNPLFIVELSRSRAELEDDVPLTLQAAIAARLDELAPIERDVLQCASIVGDTFGMREAALLSDRLPAEVAGVLGRLTHLRHVEPVDGAFRFHHVLVRDAAYGRLPTSARMKLHARFAREGLDPDDVEALAHHWWEALGPPDADWVWEDQSERETMRVEALRAHLAAGERLAERLAVERMVVVFERALQFTSGAIEAAKTEEAFGLGYHRNAKGDEAIVHRLRAIELYKSSGREAPARLYADTLDIPVYNWGYFHKQPDVDSTLRLIDDGIAVARRADEPRTLMRLLVQRGLFANDNTVIDEIDRLLRITATERDQADVLWRLALMTAVAMHDVKRARAALDVAFELANQGARFNEAEARLWGCTVLFHAGDLAGAEKHADRLDTISRTQSPHSRQHAFGAKGIIELARGNWQGLADLARDLRELVAANPDGSFCIMGANLAAHGAMADLVLGRVLPDDLVALEERLLPEASSTRAAAVLPAMAMAGRPGDDEEAARSYDFGRRIADRQAVFDLGAMNMSLANVIRERWDEAERWVPRLEDLAARGAVFSGALAAAVREEIAHGRGGPAPEHRALRDLGYPGFSQLLSYRPVRTSIS